MVLVRLAPFLAIGLLSLTTIVAAATSQENKVRAFPTRSLVHIFPPRGKYPEADFFAPTCTPSPLLTRIPPNDQFDIEPSDRHAKGPTAPKASGVSGLRMKPKVTKCREGAGIVAEKRKSKSNAFVDGGIGDVTINDNDMLEEAVDTSLTGSNEVITNLDMGDAVDDELDDMDGENLGGNEKQLLDSSQATIRETNAVDGNLASAHGVTFEYGEGGSVEYIAGGIAKVEDVLRSIPEGPFTIFYDDKTGSFYTMEESPPDSSRYIAGSAPAVHGATAGMKGLVFTKEEENEFLEAMAYGPEDNGHNDGPGGSIRGFAVLCTYVLSLVLMLHV